MLFDLRSRGRRHTVRVIYLFLALVMVAGLVLVGVGTGSNQGGLLNAFTNNGSGGGGGSQLAEQQLKKAIRTAQKNPNSASAWYGLVQARWSAANSGSNYNSTTGAYSASGKKQLSAGAQAWQKYLKVTNDKPTLNGSILAARIYETLGQWSDEATAWNYAAQSATGSSVALKPYLCLALSAYAAKQTTKGDLAAAQAVKLTPKLQRLTLQSTLKSAKSSTTTAEQTLVAEC